MKSLEERILATSNSLLDQVAGELFPSKDLTDARLEVLEIMSALHAGRSVSEYWQVTQQRAADISNHVEGRARAVLASIGRTEIPVPLALAALAREILPPSLQRTTGAYYTDWRLAELLARTSVAKVGDTGLWIDLACGSGILLVAAVMSLAQKERDAVIRDKLCGADLSARALRGTLMAVSSLTEDIEAIQQFQRRLFCGDSLRRRDRWKQLAPCGFALVIGNPPWERLRTSRHETASADGRTRHYGQNFDTDVDVRRSRREMTTYIESVAGETRLQGRGEHDLYKLFLELAIEVAADQGVVALLVPAGLIRSKGTESLRKELDSLASELSVSVLENRQGYFSIDSRFKFLAVIAKIGSGDPGPIHLLVADRTGRISTEGVRLHRAEIRNIRRDLSLPEVRNEQEWQLFSRLSSSGYAVGDPDGPWSPSYRRELDMTNDRRRFERGHQFGNLPIVEGRHVSQFRSRAKAYLHGEGRAAIWKSQDLRSARFVPQWSIDPEQMRKPSLEAASRSRVGFCDITGQTNERSLLVARIPAGVACGNKVPTLSFPSGGADREDMFIAVANSFVADWMLRRIVTTTVNFFLLDSLPLPLICESSDSGLRILELSRKLTRAEGDKFVSPWTVAGWRAEIDARVASAWDVRPEEMQLMMQDFPLLDRKQPPIDGETRSTITQDLVVSSLASLLGEELAFESVRDRVQHAKAAGAIPYVPGEFS